MIRSIIITCLLSLALHALCAFVLYDRIGIYVILVAIFGGQAIGIGVMVGAMLRDKRPSRLISHTIIKRRIIR